MNTFRDFVVSALVAISLPAVAADLPAQTSRQSAVVAPIAFSWTGVYLGVMGGYAKGAGDLDQLDGGFAGGTVGYNWQAPGSPFVFGVEGDGAWSNFGQTVTEKVGVTTVKVSTDTQAIATLRARLGAAFDRTLVFVTGGGAWARNEITGSATLGGYTAGVSDVQTHIGYAIGGGLEQAFAGGWSGKVEYLYLGLGSEKYFNGKISSGDVDIHTLKVGVNYRFGGM
jgi:outer membrane immunogenic protein